MRLTLAVCLCLALGCAGNTKPGAAVAAPETRPVAVGGDLRMSGSAVEAVSNTVDFPAAKVFIALPQVYDSLGIPLTTIDFKGHIIGNQGMIIRQKLGKVALSKYIDCGKAQLVPSADTYEVYLSVVTHVAMDSATAPNSTVTTTVASKARPLEHSQEYFDCKTTGELEKRIVTLLHFLVR